MLFRSNFDYPWDKEEEQDPATVTPIAGGDPTYEEAEEAFDRLFEESQNALDKRFGEAIK